MDRKNPNNAEKPDGAVPDNKCAEPGALNVGSDRERLRSLSNNGTAEIPESVNETYKRLVLDAPSLLPPCDMPVARLLFAEWLAEQAAQNEGGE